MWIVSSCVAVATGVNKRLLVNYLAFTLGRIMIKKKGKKGKKGKG